MGCPAGVQDLSWKNKTASLDSNGVQDLSWKNQTASLDSKTKIFEERSLGTIKREKRLKLKLWTPKFQLNIRISQLISRS